MCVSYEMHMPMKFPQYMLTSPTNLGKTSYDLVENQFQQG